MKNYHSVRYYEKRLYKLQTAADAIHYPIDDNTDYIRATALLSLTVQEGGTGKETIPAAFSGHMARLVMLWKWQEGSINNVILL